MVTKKGDAPEWYEEFMEGHWPEDTTNSANQGHEEKIC